MYKILASIDGDTAEDNVIEAYTDGTLWNGWTSGPSTRRPVPTSRAWQGTLLVRTCPRGAKEREMARKG